MFSHISSLLFQLKSYLIFLFKSGNEHGLHSPFIFDLYSTAIRPPKFYYCFAWIEDLRSTLLANSNVIQVTDMGTGRGSYEKSIGMIAQRTLKPARIAQMLFRVVEYLQPNSIIDLGTSLGVTTAYLASANTRANVYSFEGCSNIAKEAEHNFNRLSISNVKLNVGNIDQTLPNLLATIPHVDFAFIDANHTYEATLRYFEMCMSRSHAHTVIVFDDIYWSEGMASAWNEIKSDPRVALSIDFFYLGMVFLRPFQPKQHFILRL